MSRTGKTSLLNALAGRPCLHRTLGWVPWPSHFKWLRVQLQNLVSNTLTLFVTSAHFIATLTSVVFGSVSFFPPLCCPTPKRCSLLHSYHPTSSFQFVFFELYPHWSPFFCVFHLARGNAEIAGLLLWFRHWWPWYGKELYLQVRQSSYTYAQLVSWFPHPHIIDPDQIHLSRPWCCCGSTRSQQLLFGICIPWEWGAQHDKQDKGPFWGWGKFTEKQPGGCPNDTRVRSLKGPKNIDEVNEIVWNDTLYDRTAIPHVEQECSFSFFVKHMIPPNPVYFVQFLKSNFCTSTPAEVLLQQSNLLVLFWKPLHLLLASMKS